MSVHLMFLILALRQHLSHINSRLRDGVTERNDVVDCAGHFFGVVDALRLVNNAYSFVVLVSNGNIFIRNVPVAQSLQCSVRKRPVIRIRLDEPFTLYIFNEPYNFIHYAMIFTIHLIQIQFVFLVLALRQHLSHINSRLRDGVTESRDVVECAEYHAGVVDATRLLNSTFSFLNLIFVTFTFIMAHLAALPFTFDIQITSLQHLSHINSRVRDGVTERNDVVDCTVHFSGVVDAVRLRYIRAELDCRGRHRGAVYRGLIKNKEKSERTRLSKACNIVHFMFLVVALRQHLSHINSRLRDGVTERSDLVECAEYHAELTMILVKVKFMFLVLALRQHLSHINSRLRDGVMERSDVVECAEYHAGVANDTSVIVHELMRRTKDKSLQQELGLFSLQLLHSQVKFTACGLFNLDYSLLHSLIGASTIYLIILIQFQLSPESSQKEANELNLTDFARRWGQYWLAGGAVLLSTIYGFRKCIEEGDVSVLFVIEFTIHLVKAQFLFLVLALRQHLSHINSRLRDGVTERSDVVECAEVPRWCGGRHSAKCTLNQYVLDANLYSAQFASAQLSASTQLSASAQLSISA
uniref:Gustatory receptor n=1 Tax=Timema californicum TaxID=61474 RepID=A0A7R9P8R7_TIMCA|nr:unnamed protein product [Timema californicum]